MDSLRWKTSNMVSYVDGSNTDLSPQGTLQGANTAGSGGVYTLKRKGSVASAVTLGSAGNEYSAGSTFGEYRLPGTAMAKAEIGGSLKWNPKIASAMVNAEAGGSLKWKPKILSEE